MPEHQTVLDAAYKTMTRNDYLLTAAILAQVFALDPQAAKKAAKKREKGKNYNGSPYAPGEYELNADQDIWTSSYERYSQGTHSTVIHSETSTDILLDGTKVATWAFWENLYTSNSHGKLIPELSAEQTIFRSVGLTESEYLHYRSREKVRWQLMEPSKSITYKRAQAQLKSEVVFDRKTV
jgi:hypothetical protein